MELDLNKFGFRIGAETWPRRPWRTWLVDGVDGSALVLADNLAPYVRGPARQAADAYFGDLGLELRRHDTLWGGAIQFVDAASKAA